MSSFVNNHIVIRPVIQNHNNLVLELIVMGDLTNSSEELKYILRKLQAQNEAKLI